MQKSLLLFAAAVLAALLPDRADAITLYAQQDGINGGAITEIASGPDFASGSFSGDYGTFSLTLFGGASSNTADLSSLLSAAVSIENNSSSTETILLFVSQADYDLPEGSPLLVESGLSGTVNRGTLAGAGTFQAYLDSGNQLLGLDDFTNGPQAVVFDGSTFGTGSAFGSFDRDGLYSITSVVKATISGGGEGNFSSHVNVMSTPIPEPGTVVMGLLGLPALGLVALRRRRKA